MERSPWKEKRSWSCSPFQTEEEARKTLEIELSIFNNYHDDYYDDRYKITSYTRKTANGYYIAGYEATR